MNRDRRRSSIHDITSAGGLTALNPPPSSPTMPPPPSSPTTTAAAAAALPASPFSLLSDDIILLILSKLDREPHHWPRLCCVSPRFSYLIRSSCYPSKCLRSLPHSLHPLPPSSLLKLCLCCPGPLLAGIPPHRHPSSSSPGPHPASVPFSLSREEGARLLANRFRDDRLHVSSWPACRHPAAPRDYLVFRGVFQGFDRSAVRRAIVDARPAGPPCAFCTCPATWDLHALSCLRRAFECHGDGEPVVRAYACMEGHVSGVWTERSMYS